LTFAIAHVLGVRAADATASKQGGSL